MEHRCTDWLRLAGCLCVYNVKWPLDKISALKTKSSGYAMNNQSQNTTLPLTLHEYLYKNSLHFYLLTQNEYS